VTYELLANVNKGVNINVTEIN